MRNEKWKNDFSPLDEYGVSFVDKAYSKAYLRHLFISNELLAMQIASIHNLAFYLWLVKEAQNQIKNANFVNWKKEMTEQIGKRL